jgi:hypothetical protein
MSQAARIAAALAMTIGATVAQAQITFDPAVGYAASTNPEGVALADFGGDGRPDLAVTADAPNRVLVRMGTGGGLFGAPAAVALAGGSGPHSLVAVNVDNDSDMDLVVTLQNTDQVQFLVNSAGVLAAGATADVDSTEPRFLAAGDLDGNGFADIVTANRAGNSVSVLLNSAGVLGAAAVYALGGEARGVALGDVDGDQRLDIVVANNDGRAVEVLLNLPASPGVFTPGPSLPVGAQLRPDGVDVADLDGDGDADVLTATSGNGLNLATVFFNLGAGSFGGATSFPAGGLNPGAVLAADLDRDGRRDIVLANQDSATVTILRNLGAGSFAGAFPLAVGTNPQDLAAADLDLNGSLDLACANQDSSSVSVLLNSSVAFADGFESGNLSHWTIVSP